MKKHRTIKTKMELNDKYELIIIGGGTAGATAGIAAARMGVKTLIIEQGSCLGGTSTLAQVTPMMPVKMKNNPDSSAINKEIKKILFNKNAGAKDKSGNDGWFNPEELKFILEDLYLKAGGNLLYDSTFIKAEKNNSQIENVIIKNKSGLKAYKATYYLDCSGDAELADSVNLSMQEKEEKNYQAVSLRFIMDGVNIKEFADFLEKRGQNWGLDYPLVETAYTGNGSSVLAEEFKNAVEDGILKEEDLKYFQIFSLPGSKSKIAFNCPEIPFEINPLDTGDITKAYIEGRKIIKRLLEFTKSYLAAFENAELTSQAEMLGVRDSRRIKGEYTFDINDYHKRNKFKDVVASSAYPVDIHGKNLNLDKLKKDEYYQIPYRVLIPQDIDNLLVAGRCVSASFIGQSAIRIQPICRAFGEAAGIASALALENNKKFNQVSAKKIKKIMLAWGADI